MKLQEHDSSEDTLVGDDIDEESDEKPALGSRGNYEEGSSEKKAKETTTRRNESTYKPAVQPEHSSRPLNLQAKSRNYIIHNVHPTITKFDLGTFLSKIGTIQKIYFECKTTAFVQFTELHNQTAATIDFEVKGHRMRAVETMSVPIQQPTRSIMVSGNIARISKSDIEKYFSAFGEVERVSDTSKKSEYCWKYIFVKFKEYSSAEKVIGELFRFKLREKC